MSWRDLVRGVLFRCVAEAWVETDSAGRRQWGWRLGVARGTVIFGRTALRSLLSWASTRLSCCRSLGTLSRSNEGTRDARGGPFCVTVSCCGLLGGDRRLPAAGGRRTGLSGPSSRMSALEGRPASAESREPARRELLDDAPPADDLRDEHHLGVPPRRRIAGLHRVRLIGHERSIVQAELPGSNGASRVAGVHARPSLSERAAVYGRNKKCARESPGFRPRPSLSGGSDPGPPAALAPLRWEQLTANPVSR